MRAARRRWASTTCASPAASRSCAASSRGSRAMLAAIAGVDDLAVTTNGYLLERDAEALVRAGVDRFNVSIDSLQRDRFFEMTRRDALPRVLRGLEALARVPRGAPDQGQRRRDARLHRGRGAAVRALRARAPLRGALHRVHAARRRPRLGRRTACSPATRSARRSTPSTRSSPSRASRTRRRACTASPTAGAGSASSTRSPSRSAATATASASPPTGACAPACSRCNETDLRAPLRVGRHRRRPRADHPRRRLAQGAQAPRQRAGLRAAGALDERDRRLTRRRGPGTARRDEPHPRQGPGTEAAGCSERWDYEPVGTASRRGRAAVRSSVRAMTIARARSAGCAAAPWPARRTAVPSARIDGP